MKKKILPLLLMPFVLSPVDEGLFQELQAMDDSKVGECSKCQRWTWDKEQLGTVCGMPQPDNSGCVGVFIKRTSANKE